MQPATRLQTNKDSAIGKWTQRPWSYAYATDQDGSCRMSPP
jgi:hypothetical protein